MDPSPWGGLFGLLIWALWCGLLVRLCYHEGMDLTLIVILLLFAVLNVGALWFFVGRQKPQNREAETEGMVLLQGQMQELARVLDNKVGEMTVQMTESVKLWSPEL